MKYAIISDIHSNLEALQSAIKVCEENKVKKIISLGDIVGYNANPCECIEIAQNKFFLSIKGNHDQLASRGLHFSDYTRWSSDAIHGIEHTISKISDKHKIWLDSLDYYATIKDRKIPFLIGHGIPFHKDGCSPFDYIIEDYIAHAFMKFLKEDHHGFNLAFFGHTHRACAITGYKNDNNSSKTTIDKGYYLTDEKYGTNEISLDELIKGNKFLIINPGSIGQPRTDSHKPSLVILDTIKKYLQFISFDYDFKKAQKAIRSAGYSEHIAGRLECK